MSLAQKRQSIFGMKPTEEQWYGVELAAMGKPFALNALAGTGKTATLKMSAAVYPGKLILLLFNDSMAKEARASLKEVKNIKVYTSHAYARRRIRVDQERLNLRLHGGFVAERYGLGSFVMAPGIILSPSKMGGSVLYAISKFCNTSARNVGVRHVPTLETLFRNIPPNIEVEVSAFAQFQQLIINAARKLWDDQVNPLKRNIPISHNTYLKQWLLTDPVIDAGLMMDEAQDTNEALMQVVSAQENPVFWTGDRYQQIYEWRNAVNAMSKIQCQNTGYLTQSFRFGENVADQANRALKFLGSEKLLTGSGGNPKDGTAALLARTNAECLRVMVECVEKGREDVAIVGGDKFISEVKALGSIAEGKPGSGAYSLFKNWDEVKEFSESSEGGDVGVLVKMIDEYGADKLIGILKKQSTIKSRFLISTCHKSKGLEYDHVKIAGDWRTDSNGNPYPLSEAETRLMYVALTRARCTLNTEQVEPWLKMIDTFNDLGVTAKKVEEAMKRMRRSGGSGETKTIKQYL